MNRKHRVIVSITGIILVCLVLIGLTYGYYSTKIKGNMNDKSVTVSLAKLELTYDDGNGLIEAKNIIPGELISTKTFSVENTGDKKVINYTIYLDDVVNTFQNRNDVKLSLTCTSDKGNKCLGTEISYPTNNAILTMNDIEVGEVHNYELKVEFIETNTDQSIDMNKELSGNIIINDLKSTSNTLTNNKGIEDIELNNPKLISNYRIYGNSVQEVRSGKNLFDFTSSVAKSQRVTVTKNDNGFNAKSQQKTSGYNNYFYVPIIVLPTETTTYTLSLDFTSSDYTADTLMRVGYWNSNGTWVDIKNATIKNSGKQSITFDVENNYDNIDETKKISLFFNVQISETTDYTTINVNNIQIEEGSKATEYETYGVTPSPEIPSEVESVGDLETDGDHAGKYKIPISIQSQNFLNPKNFGIYDGYKHNGLTFNVDNEGIITINGTAVNSVPYVISTNNGFSSTENSTFTLCGCKGGSSSTYYLQTQNGYSDYGSGVKVSLPVDKNIIRLYVKAGTVFENVKITPMLIKGDYVNKVPEYIPYSIVKTNVYLNEPLRKIGDYADYIDYKNGEVIRKVGQFILENKDYVWSHWNRVKNFGYRLYIGTTNVLNTSQLSNYFLDNYAKAYRGNHGYFHIDTGGYINQAVDNIITSSQSATLMNDWSKTKSINGNPVKYYYVLKNEEIEKIDLLNLNYNDGYNYVNITTKISPSSVELEYIK